MTAKALGFDRPTANSLDSVADRDFVLETLAAAAICATHLSRFAEEIVLWTTPQFGFIRLSDAFSTGSSIMPQKRNPDAAELVRGKTGRVVGALVALFSVMKGLPLAYSKDMQEDKEGAFDALQTLSLTIAATAGMVRDMTPDLKRMKASAGAGYSTATDLADWLVRDAENAVPRGASCHRPHRRGGFGTRRRAGEAAARGDAGGRAAHRRGSVRRARRRALGQEPHELWRNRASQCAQTGAPMDRAAEEGGAHPPLPKGEGPGVSDYLDSQVALA